jgi:flagellin
MIINNNIPAMNTHRQLGINQNAMQNSMEKLSSGLRINKAADDSAGLAISEKMRAQINGLDQASRNAQDGISLIQTAEGGLDETHSILQRMRELAVQSANDTNVGVDRDEIQKEVNQLSAEISRISETTEFNTQNLLGGDFEGKLQIGANTDQNINLAIADMSAQALGVSGDGVGQATYQIEGGDVTLNATDLTNVGIVAGEQELNVVEIDNVTFGAGEVANFGLANENGEIVATSQDGKDYTTLNGAYKVSDLKSADVSHANDVISFNDKVVSGTVSLTQMVLQEQLLKSQLQLQ